MTKPKKAKKIMWAAWLAGTASLLISCNQQDGCEFDSVVRERVFLECVRGARGPERLTVAGNDLDEAIRECGYYSAVISRRCRSRSK